MGYSGRNVPSAAKSVSSRRDVLWQSLKIPRKLSQNELYALMMMHLCKGILRAFWFEFNCVHICKVSLKKRVIPARDIPRRINPFQPTINIVPRNTEERRKNKKFGLKRNPEFADGANGGKFSETTAECEVRIRVLTPGKVDMDCDSLIIKSGPTSDDMPSNIDWLGTEGDIRSFKTGIRRETELLVLLTK